MEYNTLVAEAERVAFNLTSAYIRHQTAPSRPLTAVKPPRTIYQHMTADLSDDETAVEVLSRQYSGFFDEVSLRLQEAAYQHLVLTKDSVEIHGEHMSVVYLMTRRASTAQHSFAHQQITMRHAVIMTMLWVSQQDRLAEVLEMLAHLTYLVMMDDGEDDGLTQDQRKDVAQQALWLHIVMSLHTSIEHTTASVLNPDTPWAWQRPLLGEQFIHAVDTIDRLRSICAMIVKERNF